jgi:hypothetical protein
LVEAEEVEVVLATPGVWGLAQEFEILEHPERIGSVDGVDVQLWALVSVGCTQVDHMMADRMLADHTKKHLPQAGYEVSDESHYWEEVLQAHELSNSCIYRLLEPLDL